MIGRMCQTHTAFNPHRHMLASQLASLHLLAYLLPQLRAPRTRLPPVQAAQPRYHRHTRQPSPTSCPPNSTQAWAKRGSTSSATSRATPWGLVPTVRSYPPRHGASCAGHQTSHECTHRRCWVVTSCLLLTSMSAWAGSPGKCAR